MNKTKIKRRYGKKCMGVLNKKTALNSFFASFLKFSIAVALLFVIALFVTAGDVIIENGKLNVNNSFYVDGDGNVGIGTSPGSKLHIRQSVDSNVGGFMIQDVGGANFRIWKDSGNTYFYRGPTLNLMTFNDATGNVGIGTTSPTKKLQIQGGNDNGILITDASDNNRVILAPDGDGDGEISLYDQSTVLKVLIRASGDSFLDGGNVGIGTASPGAPLHIKRDSSLSATQHLIISNTDPTNGNAAYIKFLGSSVVNYGDIGTEFVDRTSGSEDGSLIFSTRVNGAMAEGMRIHNGNVGIGTANPQETLHVRGWIMTETAAANPSVHFKDSTSGQVYTLQIDSSNNNFQLYDNTAGQSRIVVKTDGNVGIGTTNPDHDLEIGTGTYSEIDAGEAQFTTGSSKEYKENIRPIAVQKILDKISTIPVTTYDFREEYCDSADDKCKNKLGLIAEDFHVIFKRGSDKEINGQEVQMALWLAVQELTKENQQLKSIICLDYKDAEICT